MKKKQGFTLIELLAVIVILAVIALITTPLILGVIEKAKKGALEDTAYGLIDSANIYFAEGILDESQSKTEFTFEDGKQTSEKKLSYKGKVEKGSLRLFSDGKNALCISDGNNSAVKNVNDKKVKVVTGRCTYNSETDEYETVGLCQDLQDQLDALKKKRQEELDKLKKDHEDKMNQLKKDHADQIKALEESYQDQIDALNSKIVELEATHQVALDQLKKDYEVQIKTMKEAYEAQIAESNRQLNVFKTSGTASVSQILAGQTAFVKGKLLTGTMKNNGAVNTTVNSDEIYTIPEGYHNGSGKVIAGRGKISIKQIGGFDATTGSGTIDVKNYTSVWASLSIDNFWGKGASWAHASGGPWEKDVYAAPSLSYNASNGILNYSRGKYGEFHVTVYSYYSSIYLIQ